MDKPTKFEYGLMILDFIAEGGDINEIQPRAKDRSGNYPIPHSGICLIMDERVMCTEDRLFDFPLELLEDWPEWSGSQSYPVPNPGFRFHGPARESAFGAYHRGDGEVNDHRWKGEYGELRRDLARHAAEWMREMYEH